MSFSTQQAIIATLGVACDLGAWQCGSRFGPRILQRSNLLKATLATRGLALDWVAMLQPAPGREPLESLRNLTTNIALHTSALVLAGQPMLVCGGDHAQAMGVWRGALEALKNPRRFGLVWIDAHMDAHDFSSSPTGNIHGMPLAALLGTNDLRLRRIMGSTLRLNPELVVLIGARSFQPEEAAFLHQAGVECLAMPKLGLAQQQSIAIQAAIQQLAIRCDNFGISIDIDALDPTYAPAVATPAAGGIDIHALCEALATVQNYPGFIGLEIAEFLPAHDRQRRTEKAIGQIILSTFAAAQNTGLHCA